MKYAWVDGKIKFYTHEKDGKYYFDAVEGATPIEQPSTELLAKCEGKTFKNYSEAKSFIEGNNIAMLKAELAETDYKIIKSYEYELAGLELPYNIAELHAERQAIRDRINAIEGD
jgi:hypothetical protein